MTKMTKNRVVVTGGAGTIGKLLVDKLLLSGNFHEVLSLDNNEGALFFQREKYGKNPNFSSEYIDICDLNSLSEVFQGASLVFHCAASKNVPMCEIAPNTCANVNIKGVECVVSAARAQGVSRVVFTSSDKAVSPTNVMGATKLIGERILLAAGRRQGDATEAVTKFSSTRFGNVLGSTGSVLPIFAKQILNGLPITITDPDMTRFMMSQNEAVDLVLMSAELSKGNEIFITKMPVVRIGTFAEALFELFKDSGFSNKKKFEDQVEILGARAGEKRYEELMTDEERNYSREGDNFFVVLPRGVDYEAFSEGSRDFSDWPAAEITYNSSALPPLDLEQTKAFILSCMKKDGFRLEDFEASF